MTQNIEQNNQEVKRKIEGVMSVVDGLFIKTGLSLGAALGDNGKPVVLIVDSETGYKCALRKKV